MSVINPAYRVVNILCQYQDVCSLIVFPVQPALPASLTLLLIKNTAVIAHVHKVPAASTTKHREP